VFQVGLGVLPVLSLPLVRVLHRITLHAAKRNTDSVYGESSLCMFSLRQTMVRYHC
jgi:hypothetical protein